MQGFLMLKKNSTQGGYSVDCHVTMKTRAKCGKGEVLKS